MHFYPCYDKYVGHCVNIWKHYKYYNTSTFRISLRKKICISWARRWGLCQRSLPSQNGAKFKFVVDILFLRCKKLRETILKSRENYSQPIGWVRTILTSRYTWFDEKKSWNAEHFSSPGGKMKTFTITEKNSVKSNTCLLCNFICKNVTFTKFLSKKSESKFPWWTVKPDIYNFYQNLVKSKLISFSAIALFMLNLFSRKNCLTACFIFVFVLPSQRNRDF